MVARRCYISWRHTYWVSNNNAWFATAYPGYNSFASQFMIIILYWPYFYWPNVAVNSGVHPSLHVKYHHQIIHCKFNLMIVYPPPYERLVWDYKRANTDAIITSINQVDWEFMFSIRIFTSKFTYLTKH